MRNLLEETVLEINGSDHVVENVSWVGSMDGKYAITWDDPYLSIDLGQLARELLFEQESNNKC